MAKKVKYTAEQKYEYHSKREYSCGKFGLKFGGPRHSYSCGFIDAFHGHDNTAATAREFGSKSGKGYAAGYKNGKKAAKEYSKRTGKPPFTLEYK